ncbi:MAG: enoyl-CoA hydratase-related protein [Gammaproteobacteria bacterium]|nr:enoyl-CoA hydratase-related protein [Gammaproteobacteria bacterium]
MDYSQYSDILVECHDDGVLLATLNRPKRLNALDERLLGELNRLWLQLADDSNVRVVVVTGAGQAFSVGADIDLVGTFNEDVERSIDSSVQYTSALRRLMDLHKPVIAAVNGDVLGGGLGIALLCDVIFMARGARMLTASQLRINALPAPDAFLWPARGVSSAKAKYHLFKSSTIDAAEAERIGLISVVTDDATLLDEALDFARDLARRDPRMLSWTKRALSYNLRAASPLLDEWLSLESLSFARDAVKDGLNEMRKVIGKER